MRILVIEDEIELCESIAEGLKADGYETDTSNDGAAGLELLFSEEYDLVVLDLNLPTMDGMDVLKAFREENQETPVLILSARIALADKIQGLDEGANDYLTKPFHFEELEARIRSLTRRKFVQKNTILKSDHIEFDTQSRKTFVKGNEVHLTRKETGILEYLLLHQGQLISQEELIEHVWDMNADEFSASIRVHMSSLRKKLKGELSYDPIQNKIGQGYMIGGLEQ